MPALRPVSGSIVVPYLLNRISYTYDPTTNRYRRAVTGAKVQVDAGTKTAVAPANVIVLKMTVGPLVNAPGASTNQEKGRLELGYIGSGPALVFNKRRRCQSPLVQGQQRRADPPDLRQRPTGRPTGAAGAGPDLLPGRLHQHGRDVCDRWRDRQRHDRSAARLTHRRSLVFGDRAPKSGGLRIDGLSRWLAATGATARRPSLARWRDCGSVQGVSAAPTTRHGMSVSSSRWQLAHTRW